MQFLENMVIRNIANKFALMELQLLFKILVAPKRFAFLLPQVNLKQ